MKYKCNKCNNEFDGTLPIHPHPGGLGGRLSMYGCPVCAKIAATPIICPKCLSADLTPILK